MRVLALRHFTAVVLLGLLAGSVLRATPVHAAEPLAVKVTDAIPERPVQTDDELFFDEVFSFNTPDGNGVIASTPDGLGDVFVDDEILIKVTRPDGSEDTLIKNYEFQPPSPPIDISNLLDPGVNTIRIGLRDTFGVALSSSALWLVGGTDQDAGTSEVYSPEYKVVRWFKPLQDVDGTNYRRCVLRLTRAGIGGSIPSCIFLLNTGNPPPPANMSAERWRRFIRGREYRGLLALPEYRVTCSATGMVTATEAVGEPYTSGGYTPTLGHWPPSYPSADRYINEPDYASGVPTVTTAPDRRSVHISLKVASRLGLLERGPGWPITGYDAPYIWTVLHAKIDCSGRTSATLTFSDFPSLVAYQDGAGATRGQQNSKFEDFMTSGGRLPSGPNSDKLRSKCRIYAFPGALTDPIPASPTKADCERGRRDGFLATDRFRATY